jgi:multidrug efflux pump subunit AcrB
MWIVRLALDKPYTFAVMALLLLILGGGAIRNTPTDIFPNIDIPVISVVWNYAGLTPLDMERQMTTYSEYGISNTVPDIKTLESQTYNGVSVIKIHFHPTVRIDAAIAQVTAVNQYIVRRMPPGATPPFIIRYNAGSVPILQISLSSDTMTESQLYDYGTYQIRRQLSVVQGTQLPIPYGGAVRQVMVDINPEALQARGLSAQDVASAINAQNLTLPTGTAKFGQREYTVRVNSTPEAIEAINDVPVRVVNGTTIRVRDVAHVHDGFSVQTNMVRRDGRRGVLLTVMKTGNASTLDIARRIKDLLPTIRAAAPKEMRIDLLADQSVFVEAAIDGVLHEGAIAAALTAAMILVFLGSWRSTLIVTVSIPLSIAVSLIALWALGQTLNIMTLGGLALAVGILVDDATVEIENIHRNLAMGKPLRRAILDGAQQIAAPSFVSTLAICIVFVPVVFLTGPAVYLFTPMAMAVVFAMMASYLLSRTVIPTLSAYLLPGEIDAHARHGGHGVQAGPHDPDPFADGSPASVASAPPRVSVFGRLHAAFECGFDALRDAYVGVLAWCLTHRPTVLVVAAVMVGASAAVLPLVGRDFFPDVDAGQIRLHVRAPAGTRIEETERVFTRVEDLIRRVIPDDERELILDNIGLPDGVNLAFSDLSTLGSGDGDILVSLRHGHKRSSREYITELRRRLAEECPDLTCYFQPADIVGQILSFGLPASVDIRLTGSNREATYRLAQEIRDRVAAMRGAADVRVQQIVDGPQLYLNVDRVRAAEAGLSQRDVANNMLVNLSGSFQVTPTFWIDPKTGLNYPVAVKTPERRIDDLDALKTLGAAPPAGAAGSASPSQAPQLLADLTAVERRNAPLVVTHSNIQAAFDVCADVEGADLGTLSSQVAELVEEYRAKLPPGSSITLRGKAESMDSAFVRLGVGLGFAALLVYLLMVVNFQGWLDPFIIITALPAALCGVVWMLLATGTTFSVPSLMGAIMCVGVATANSILIVSFANGQRAAGRPAIDAALAAGHTRLRPVLMTALAMLIGMLPMSLGLGEGGEQNAPLGRAVIGGLALATPATLLIVPVIYSLLRADRRPAAAFPRNWSVRPLSPWREQPRSEA